MQTIMIVEDDPDIREKIFLSNLIRNQFHNSI